MDKGTRLGRYEILEPLGAGGMGEVYRARDTELNREIALKILPDEVSADPERVTRLRREAQMLAAVSHPNIATIHSVGEAKVEATGSVRFLDMELIDGMTLAERLRGGPLPVDQALVVCRQIADALEAAHDKGIIHRDLKPGNVMLSQRGQVKVLDFGLAKVIEVGEVTGLTGESTTADRVTASGALVGTAPYMSPEQVTARSLDKRTDIWAFGCILYETLAGRRPFAGESISETVAAILKEEPDWSAVPIETPATARALLRRCLRKDPDQRLHDVADARIEIEEALNETPGESPGVDPVVAGARSWRRTIPWPAAAGLAVLAALAAGVTVRSLTQPATIAPRPVSRTAIDLAPAKQLEPVGRPFALSPDGTQLVFTGRFGSVSRLYLRDIDDFEATPIEGTEGAHTPFFAPDGRWLGFFTAEGKLKKISLDGGAPLTICDAPTESHGASWGPDDTIVFAPASADLMRVSANGGRPEIVASPDRDQAERGYYWPQILPGGRAVLVTIWGGGGGIDAARIAVLSLETGTRTVLLDSATGARYTSTGHLLYASSAGLLAVPFDLERVETTAAPVSILDRVRVGGDFGAAYFALSDSGTLVYLGDEEVPGRLAWVDRAGTVKLSRLWAADASWPDVKRPQDKGLGVQGSRVSRRFRVNLTVLDAQFLHDAVESMWRHVDARDRWSSPAQRQAFLEDVERAKEAYLAIISSLQARTPAVGPVSLAAQPGSQPRTRPADAPRRRNDARSSP